MTQDEKVALLKEAGVWDVIGYPTCIDKLFNLVAAHWQKIHTQEMSMMSELCADRILEEREACAKVCDGMPTYVDRHNSVIQSSATACAAAIRSRSSEH